MSNRIRNNWYWIIIGGFIVFATAVFAILGENSVIAVHDNLDLFVPQYQMMKDSGTFFSHNAIVGFLDGQGRDYLPSEFNLVTVIYMIMPAYAAYITCYICKILIAILGAWLFAKDVFNESYVNYKPIIFLVGFAYGILNLFPNFGIPFASIPLLLFIMHRIIEKPRWFWFVALFAYPFISYFSYLGIFFIGYICLYFVYKWIKSRKFPLRVLISIVVLSLGYVAFEYRLFYIMLFSGVESIRESMVRGSLTGFDILKEMLTGFARGDMHTESVHTYFVMPVCLIYFLIQTVVYIKQKTPKKIFTDYFNGVMLFIVANSILFGAFNYEPLRNLVEIILPPLKGFEFGRTEFSNPFLWYLAFFIVLKRIYDLLPKFKWVANCMAIVAVFVIILSGTRYNDLYSTAYSQYYQYKNGTQCNNLTYGEFYSTDLFDKAKEDINYSGQWAAAYGFYPAVLEYNGINTIDGYLGYYEESYKEAFRQVIAPALERVPESQAYYDNWGARCYLYSGTNTSIVNAYRDYSYTDEDIYINLDEFKNCGARYIFSRLVLNNADEVGLELVGTYTDEKSPYTLYLYCTESRYVDKEHSGVPFEERDCSYDKAFFDDIYNEFSNLTESANGDENFAAQLTEEDINHYLELLDAYEVGFDKVTEQYSIVRLESYQDASVDTYDAELDQVYEDSMDIYDDYCVIIRELVNSPAKVILEARYPEYILKQYEEYEEMTEEEKERNLQIQALIREYEAASIEECYFDYNGEEWNFDRLNESYDSLEYEDYLAIYNGLSEVQGSVLGEIYKELVPLYIENSEEEDYDNYLDYAYAAVYARDYTTKDVKKLTKEIRRSITPIALAYNAVASLEENNPGWITQDDTSVYQMLLPYMGTIDSELPEALEYMLENHLYDLKASATKPDTGFTMPLDYSGDAYIFDCPYQRYTDLGTYVHEYGHYNHYFRTKSDLIFEVNNLDLAEIHSQGLELLYCGNYSELYDDTTASFLEANAIYNIMEAIYSAGYVAEFEIYSFEHPEATVEELSKEYTRLKRSYGFDPQVEADYSWTSIIHLYSQPGYYISYATSALAALDIYVVSLEDYDYACEKYMELTALPDSSGFRNALQFVGLPDIFKRGVASEILQKTSSKIQGIVRESK